MQELRLRAARTACARAQVTWLRDRLLKLGAHVVGSVRRVVLHLPTATPDLHAWRHIALALGRPRRIGPSQRPSAARTRIPTAHRARPWRSRPWTAPYPDLPAPTISVLSRRRPTAATPGAPRPGRRSCLVASSPGRRHRGRVANRGADREVDATAVARTPARAVYDVLVEAGRQAVHGGRDMQVEAGIGFTW